LGRTGFTRDHEETPQRRESIEERRALTEVRLSSLFKQAGSTETVASIRKQIFNCNPKDFEWYTRYLLSIFEKQKCAVDIDAAIPVIQDAWNYFPHRFLNGRCPAEVLSELS
jgi:hypothetical protein